MNGYLVVASCNMDDFPVLLFDNKRLAQRYARDVVQQPELYLARTAELWKVDPSEFVAAKIIQFHDGTPVASETVE